MSDFMNSLFPAPEDPSGMDKYDAFVIDLQKMEAAGMDKRSLYAQVVMEHEKADYVYSNSGRHKARYDALWVLQKETKIRLGLVLPMEGVN